MIYLADPDVTIHCGDALDVLATLPDGSVDCCVTSPPYWSLRDYQVDGQLGLESTPEEYVARMVEVFRDVRRVLADHGTCWLNLGDSYATQRNDHPGGGFRMGQPNDSTVAKRGWHGGPGMKLKDLCGIPWRLAFALQADGWWLRSDIIWAKPNPMPESVTDRPTKAHEYVFLLTKQARYFYDADAVREPNVSPDQAAHNARYAKVYDAHTERVNDGQGIQPGNVNNLGIHARGGATVGRNLRSVWEIPTEPYPEAHFATYPTRLVERCLKAGCRPGGTVLDPFLGSGTTAHVARKHGLRTIGIELNPDYCELATRRLAQQSLLVTCGAERTGR